MPSLLPDAPIIRLQLAADGNWEKALHLVHGRIGADEPARWLAAASGNVALEAFVQVPQGEAFLGVRLAGLARERMHEIVAELVRRFAQQPDMPLPAFVHAIEALTGQALFKSAPSFLELGKVNAWRSFGPVVFWPNDAMQTPCDALQAALAGHPRFLEPSTLAYAIEFGFYGAIPHWYGQPVSLQVDGVHRLAPAMAEGIVANFAGLE